MKHIVLMIAISLWATVAHAEDQKSDRKGTTSTEETQGINIVHQKNLATYLGLTEQDAEFSTPRNFRENHINDMQLDQ
jgi:hypothetical protein